MLKKTTILSILSVSLCACGYFVALGKEGAKVRIVKTEPLHCKDLGTIKAYAGDYQNATNQLRNKVAQKGGNRVYLLYHTKIEIRPIPLGRMARYMYGRGFYCK